jgi:serine protease Do
MATRKTTLVYAVLIAFAAGMVIASRLDLAPASSAQTMAMPVMNSAPITGALDAQTFRNVAKTQSPTVVNVKVKMSGNSQTDVTDLFGGQPPDDLLDRLFPQGRGAPRRPQPRQEQPRPESAGTGFIISKAGLILTNNHVVEEAEEITVSLFGEDNEQQYTAKLIGRDPLTDSALIQLIDMPSHPLPEVKFGDSSQIAAGDWVMAIGNPFNLGWTVSVGVISATGRPFEVSDSRLAEMLQTDAAINPGNSGGPLLNLRGEVIGMNTAIFTNSRSGGNIGIGYAVPINSVRELLPQLHTGKVTRGRIGVIIKAIPIDGYEDFGLKSRTGALVTSVMANSAAEKGGIRPGDVVLEFNGRAVPSSEELTKIVTATKPGTSVPVKVMRSDNSGRWREQTLNLTVDELDLDAEAGRPSRGPDREPQDQQGERSFGITLNNLTAEIAREVQLPSGRRGAVVMSVDPNGPAARELFPGDVILSVGSQRVATAAEAGRELQRIASGRIAQMLVWRAAGPQGPAEYYVTVRKQ